MRTPTSATYNYMLSDSTTIAIVFSVNAVLVSFFV